MGEISFALTSPIFRKLKKNFKLEDWHFGVRQSLLNKSVSTARIKFRDMSGPAARVVRQAEVRYEPLAQYCYINNVFFMVTRSETFEDENESKVETNDQKKDVNLLVYIDYTNHILCTTIPFTNTRNLQFFLDLHIIIFTFTLTIFFTNIFALHDFYMWSYYTFHVWVLSE